MGGETASLRLPSLLLGGNEVPIGLPAAVNHFDPAERVSVLEELELDQQIRRIAFPEVDRTTTSRTRKE